MGVQFGEWNLTNTPPQRDYLDKVSSLLAPYGPDGRDVYITDKLSMLYHALHTTREACREKQPHISPAGCVITWDGRLDNRTDLIRRLSNGLTTDSTDVEIVAIAFDTWNTKAFARLIGDWALAIWDPSAHTMILCKDYVGVRPLYYMATGERIAWATVLDPLVLLSKAKFAICEEYVAGWFSSFPAPELTPYIGIRSVPPSSFVTLRSNQHTITKYWDFCPDKTVRYTSDKEYEDHYLSVFTQAVQRRLRSHKPVCLHLSGGSDSSANVCVADRIVASGDAEAPALNTVSFFNDTEPSWNERPFFTRVEEQRGQIGCHINTSLGTDRLFDFQFDRFGSSPGVGLRPKRAGRELSACLRANGNCVVISGTGGDEVTGGVPTPIPELADLMARADARQFAHQLKLWALNKRKPWFHLFFETVKAFLPPSFVPGSKHRRPPTWLSPDFITRNRKTLWGYRERIKLLGFLPSFQLNLSTLDVLRRQIACIPLPNDPAFEYRYPYLDRDLVEFIYSIPRTQLVRPGERRSLSRRALIGIVPDEVLNRRRKGFVVRAPRVAIGEEWSMLSEFVENMVTSSLGMVDSSLFREALHRARTGQEVAVVSLLRTLNVEAWLRQLTQWNVLSAEKQDAKELERQRLQMEPSSL